jgi:hypothetical protein
MGECTNKYLAPTKFHSIPLFKIVYLGFEDISVIFLHTLRGINYHTVNDGILTAINNWKI